jgi:hypothetical protein
MVSLEDAMKTYLLIPMIFALCLITAAYNPSQVCAEDKCSDVLNGGIFNTLTINQSTTTQNDYTAWLCTTEFRTHQEAYDAGISLGFLVYGVPVKLGASFESTARDTWKRDHCQTSTESSQYSATYQKLISEVSPVVVNAWRDCMLARYETKAGLSAVARSRGASAVSMKIKWQPLDSFDTKLPEVTGFSMVGATLQTVGSTLFRVGEIVPATETNVDFARTAFNLPVTLTLNTNRGSVTAYVPPQSMSLIMSATLSPTIEQRKVDTKPHKFYLHTPDDDCVKRVNFNNTYFPPDGYTFTSYTFQEKTKAGSRTTYGSRQEGNGVRFEGGVQGDDGTFGFCETSGWLGLDIQVTGEKWVLVNMKQYEGDMRGEPLQETVVLQYPYLLPSVDVRNFKLPFLATVKKLIGDDVITVQLTPGSSSASGLVAKTDASGFLTIDGTQAFKDWRDSLMAGGGGAPHILTAASQPESTKPRMIDVKAKEACTNLDQNFEVHRITATDSLGSFSVICGTSSKSVASGMPLKVAPPVMISVKQ